MGQLEQLGRTVARRETWGMALVFVGAFGIITSPVGSNSDGLSFDGYVRGVLGVIVCLSGIAMMFMQLRRAQTIREDLDVNQKDIGYLIRQLGRNYDVLRGQTSNGFLLSAAFMTIGLITIIGGYFSQSLGVATRESDLTVTAGIISEFISGSALVVYKLNFNRLNETSDRLERAWRVLAAHNLTETLPNDERATAVRELINALVK